jgi:hypothetical protein
MHVVYNIGQIHLFFNVSKILNLLICMTGGNRFLGRILTLYIKLENNQFIFDCVEHVSIIFESF